jgi:hypothetical protein
VDVDSQASEQVCKFVKRNHGEKHSCNPRS